MYFNQQDVLQPTELLSIEAMQDDMEERTLEEERGQEPQSYKFVEQGISPDYVPSFQRS